MANKCGMAKVICPYYLGETGKSITCEAVAGGGDKTVLWFESILMKQKHHIECCESYAYAEKCLLASKLEKIYKKS